MKFRKTAKRGLFYLGFTILGLVLSGCDAVKDNRLVIHQEGETTVVISNTDAIKPQKGAVKATEVVENFVGYDFYSEDELVGYKYSKSIFGDDRGLYRWQIGAEEASQKNKLPFADNPKVLKLSADKSKMFYVPEKTSGTKQIQIYDFLKKQDMAFSMPLADYFWTYSWYLDGRGGALAATSSEAYTYVEYDGNRSFTSYEIKPQTGEGETYAYIETNVFKRQGKLYYWQYGKNEGLKAYDLSSHESENVLSSKNVSQFVSSKDEKYLALTRYVEGLGHKLDVYDFETKKTQSIYSATLISNLTWNEAGNAIAFASVEKDGEVGLYYADLQKSQTVYLGTYPGQGVRQMAFSPSGNKLMVAFLNATGEDTTWETQVLTLH